MRLPVVDGRIYAKIIVVLGILSHFHKASGGGDVAGRSYKVAIFIDYAFFSVFLNWLVFYDSVSPDSIHRLEIICMDGLVGKLLENIGMRCSPASFDLSSKDSGGVASLIHPFVNNSTLNKREDRQHRRLNSYGDALALSNRKLDEGILVQKGTINRRRRRKKLRSVERLGQIWFKRIEALKSLLERWDILACDTDALWLQNPFDEGSFSNSYRSQSVIISSRGWWPHDLSQKWGAALCMGFIFFRKSVFVEDLFDEMLLSMSRVTDTNPDDQIAVNRVLDAWGVKWDDSLYPMTVNYSNETNVGYVVRGGESHEIVLLAHDKYRRGCITNMKLYRSSPAAKAQYIAAAGSSTVAHCKFAKGSSTSKASLMKTFRLWRLNNDWRTVIRSFEDRLNKNKAEEDNHKQHEKVHEKYGDDRVRFSITHEIIVAISSSSKGTRHAIHS
jgi:hypothetical protein